jgi:hypothetical protein
MKSGFRIFILAFHLASCSVDLDNEIQTDLIQEADQFFLLSEVVNETSYLGNISYPDYFRIQPSSLPGCPKIQIDTGLRKVVLDYTQPDSCDQAIKSIRNGKIILDFSRSNADPGTWSLEYNDYSFLKTKIQGKREYVRLSNSQNSETFQNLRIITENRLGFLISGSYTYFIARFNSRPFGISFVGSLQGINPAGRSFIQSITEPKEQFINCYSEGSGLPKVGQENWRVSRENGEISYQVTYQTTSDCKTKVKATLPDGRNYDIRP